MFSLNAKYVPPPGIVSPVLWGDVSIVRHEYPLIRATKV